MTKADSPTERSNAQIFRGAGCAARVRPWPGEPSIAHLVTVDQGSDVPSSLLRTWLNELRRMGYSHVRSGALHASACRSYDAIGFVAVQSLALLRAPLPPQFTSRTTQRAASPTPRRTGDVHLRRGTDSELARLAFLDRQAFQPGWGLDATSISDAMNATPAHRLRVAVDESNDAPIGYTVAGRAGKSSFLQRLAVNPAAQRRGVGSKLVVDAQVWARRWRATTMTVNTQVDNLAALRLYEECGFVLLTEQLTVMQRALDHDV